jgi:hypothetical protein
MALFHGPREIARYHQDESLNEAGQARPKEYSRKSRKSKNGHLNSYLNLKSSKAIDN